MILIENHDANSLFKTNNSFRSYVYMKIKTPIAFKKVYTPYMRTAEILEIRVSDFYKVISQDMRSRYDNS